MKKDLTEIAIMDNKAIEYLSKLSPNLIKRTLYAMTILKGDENLNDSPFAEVRHISQMYDGYIILSKPAKDLANKLAKMFAQKYPHVLMTKKELESYTNLWYRKMYEAVGTVGFEYVLDTIRRGKAKVNNPENGIVERDMLRALRWIEQREGINKESSDIHHRKKGLELLGFVGFENELLEYSFVIANIYEIVTPNNEKISDEPLVIKPIDKKEEADDIKISVRNMKVHFIQNANRILEFYEIHKPDMPRGYSEEDFIDDSIVLSLAIKGLLKDSQAVIEYVESIKQNEDLIKFMKEEFNETEMAIIKEEPDKVKALVSEEW